MNIKKSNLFGVQDRALRDPLEIVSFPFADAGIIPGSLQFSAKGKFSELLEELKITLLVSREYEHLLVALRTGSGKIHQSFFPLPHPSGLCVDHKNRSVYVASTRNPNMIVEFLPVKNYIKRKENKARAASAGILMPARVKYYPGSYYFHDLAMIRGELYANSVGRNGIIKVDFSSALAEKLTWWPKCVEKKDGRPDTSANYIQLNSIAPGNSVRESFFTASGNAVSRLRPGDPDYPVDKTGVLFSGKTRDVLAGGLTRPHSARIYKNKIWLDNSGYGEFGYIDSGKFIPIIKLPGWTRGLAIYRDTAFIGVSRILPRFRQYAPGVKNNKQECAVYAVSLRNGEILGSLAWENGNQIFAVDIIENKFCTGFLYEKIKPSSEKEVSSFYTYHH